MATTVDYLGLRFLDADFEGVRAALSRALEDGHYGYVVTPNVDHVVQYHSGDSELVSAYDGALFQVCDSRVLAKLARLSGKKLIPTPGSDLTESLLAKPLANSPRIGVIGPDREAFDMLQARYPDAKLTFIDSANRLARGSAAWSEALAATKDAGWDILLVCLSFPKQEYFAQDLGLHGRATGVALCVGASVDFLTDRQARAPKAMQKAGLEWLHRLTTNPSRMHERYLVRGPAVFGMVAKDVLGSGTHAKPPKPADGRLRVLVLSSVMPLKQETGGEICSTNFIEGLKAAGHEVEVVAYQREGDALAQALPNGYVAPRSLVIESAQSRLLTGYWLAAAYLRGRPFSVQKYVTRVMADHVRKRTREAHWDLIVIDHAQAGWVANEIPAHIPVALIAHNVEHKLYSAYGDGLSGGLKSRVKASVYRREGRLIKELERSLMRRAREVWTLSAADADEFRALGLHRPVRVFDVPGKAPPEANGAVAHVADVGLLGSWTWDVNRAGLEWFVKDVAPLLPKELDVAVGGKSPYPVGSRIGNVRFAGFVPDAADFLRGSRVVVIPTTVGSGIQIKTIETLALGAPAVVTPIAMRGLGDAPKGVTVVSDAKEMAKAIEATLAAPLSNPAAGRRWWLQRRARFETAVQSAVDTLLGRRREARSDKSDGPETVAAE